MMPPRAGKQQPATKEETVEVDAVERKMNRVLNRSRSEVDVASDDPPTVAVVVPTYKASGTIERVVRRALAVGDIVIVVDDACPERSGELVRGLDRRVHVVVHESNRGVGGATKTGMREALARGARYVAKIDSDDQMDTSYLPFMIEMLERYPELDLVKGNRFSSLTTLRTMPLLRLIGNASATLLVKVSSGYWSLVDPTNGFIAARRDVLMNIDLDALDDRYFFETDLLCAFGLHRRIVAEVEMPAIYSEPPPRPWGLRTLLPFPVKLAQRLFRRLLVQYFFAEINIGSLCLLTGVPLFLAGVVSTVRAAWNSPTSQNAGWSHSIELATLLIGSQLLIAAMFYDVLSSTATRKLNRERTASQSVRSRVRSR